MERLFALWNQAMQKPWIAKCWQFIKFGIVGVSNTLISLAVYQLALNALGLHYLAANAGTGHQRGQCLLLEQPLRVRRRSKTAVFETRGAVFQIADSLWGYLPCWTPLPGFLGWRRLASRRCLRLCSTCASPFR